MITLKYVNLRDPNFQQALQKLTNHNGFSTKTCIVIAKLKKCIDEESVIAQEHFMTLLKKYAELDESGNFVPKDNVPDTFKIIEAKIPEWQQAVKDFGEFTFDIQKSKLSLKEVETVKLSPQDYLLLESIFADELDEAANVEFSANA